MKRNPIRPTIALSALAAALAAPAVLADTLDRYEMVVPPHNVIDSITGNDVRDNRDSTKLRNDVRFDDPMPGRDAHAADSANWSERQQVENTRSEPYTATDALPAAAARDSEGDAVHSGVSDDTVNSPQGASAAAEADRERTDNLDGDVRREAVLPGDGGGEVGVPEPGNSTAETDSFEGARDTAAGVESTRGAGGAGGAGGGGAGR